MTRLTEDLWRELPKGMWFVTNATLRTIHAGSRSNEVEAVVVYDFPGGSLAVATVFRKKDWADREELATYELVLERERVPLLIGQAHDDTVLARGSLILRTRFVIGDPALAAEAELRDSQAEPEFFVQQIEERMSRL